MFCLIMTSVILLWNIYCSITKTVVRLLYDRHYVGFTDNPSREIAGVKYNIDDPPFWVKTPESDDVYTYRVFKMDLLTPYQLYNHMDCYGVRSVKVLDLKQKLVMTSLSSILVIVFSLYVHEFLTLSILVLINLVNSGTAQLFYARFILSIKSKKMKNILHYPFESMKPCDGELYFIKRGSLLMLEHCNHQYAQNLQFAKYRRNLTHVIQGINLKGKQSSTFNLEAFGTKHSMELESNETFFGGLHLFEFHLKCGRFYVRSSALVAELDDALKILENALRNLLTGVFYGGRIRHFDKIRDGSVHKKINFKCNDFSLVCNSEDILVMGCLDVNATIHSMLIDSMSKTEMDISCVRNIVEYANVFFDKENAERGFVKNLLRSLKTLIVNKSGRNLNMMPNSAWKRFSSDCGWMSNIKCKGLDYKKPSNTLVDFAKSKEIELKDPANKFYSGKDLNNFVKKSNEPLLKKEYFQQIRQSKIDLGNIASEFKGNIKLPFDVTIPNSNIFKNLIDESNNDFSKNPLLEDEVEVKTVLTVVKPTKETYKSQLLNRIKENEVALEEGKKMLRDKTIPGVQKREIKLNIPMHEYNIRSSYENIKHVEKNEVHKIINIKFATERKVGIILNVKKENKYSDEIALFNTFDILSKIDAQSNVSDEAKKSPICPEAESFINNNGGIVKAKKRIAEKIKKVTGIDCDEMLKEKIRLYIKECLININKRRIKHRKGIVAKYSRDISETDFIEDLEYSDCSLKIKFKRTGVILKREVLTDCFKAVSRNMFEGFRVSSSESALFRRLESVLRNE